MGGTRTAKPLSGAFTALLVGLLALPTYAHGREDATVAALRAALDAQERDLNEQARQLDRQRQALAALRRELVGLASAAPHPPDVDGPAAGPSGTRAMPTLRVSGHVQLDALYFPGARPGEPEDLLAPALLSLASGPPRPHTRLSARDTRLRFDAHAAGPARAVVEIDFFGGAPDRTQSQLNSYEPRLRHAYVELAPSAGSGWSVILGQTWSGFADPESLGRFYNPAPFGAVFVRQAQIRYTRRLAEGLEAFISLENPHADVAERNTMPPSMDRAPDLVLGLRSMSTSGHLRAAVLLRTVSSAESGAGMDGWGLTVSGARRLGSSHRDVLRFQLSGGEGVGRYISDLGAGFDAVTTPDGGVLPLRVVAASTSYERAWTAQWRSAIGLGRVQVSGDQPKSGEALRVSQALVANLVFHPVEHLDFGLEAALGEKQTASGRRAHGVLYRFTSRFSF